MTTKIAKVLFAISFCVSNVWATETVTLRISPAFGFQTYNVNCYDEDIFPKNVYLNAVFEGEQVIKATLIDNTDLFSIVLELTSEELKGLSFYKDAAGRLWLEQATLNGRELNWLFTRSRNCRPNLPIATLGPSPFTFTFDKNGLGEYVLATESQFGTFSGSLKNGETYNAKLKLSESLPN